MSDEDRDQGAEEIEVEVEEAPDLDEVVREALAAVDDQDGNADEEASGGDVGPGAEDELGRLRAELAEQRDRAIRVLAEFENYRKRTERERRDERRYAGLTAFSEFLDVIDNLSRALEAGGDAEDLRSGVRLIHRQMEELLRRHGVEPIEAEGRPFDPALHEAVSREEDPEVEEPTVRRVLQTGYRMHERLLRPAVVVVAMPGEPGGGDAG